MILASLNINFTLLCRHYFFNMGEKKSSKKVLKFRRKYQDVGGLKTPSFPAFLNLRTWGALPPNKCSFQLKHFVEGQNLPRRLMDKFNWQYENCHIPMISASLHQDKVLGRGGHAGDEFFFPNDFSPGHYLVRWVRVKG